MESSITSILLAPGNWAMRLCDNYSVVQLVAKLILAHQTHPTEILISNKDTIFVDIRQFYSHSYYVGKLHATERISSTSYFDADLLISA